MKTKSGNRSKSAAFTLIEIMTALSIFLVVMTISMGAILGVFDANNKSQSIKAVMNNLSLGLEAMSREMRFGSNYHCCTGNSCSQDMTAPRNCPSGGDTVSFLSNENVQITYRFNNSALEKSVSGGSYERVTGTETIIEDLKFYVLGTGAVPSNTQQPSVLVNIQGYSGRDETRADFSLQTLISQRLLDL